MAVGYTMPAWYWSVLGALAAATLLAARIGDSERWAQTTVWPVAVILGSITVSATCGDDPRESVERYATMPAFAAVFLAVQIAGWNPRALRAVLIAGATALAIVTIGLCVEWVSRASMHARPGVRVVGGLGNANDVAAAALLVPLCGAAAAGSRWRPVAHVLGALAAGSASALAASRQAVVATVIALVAPLCVPLTRRRALVAIALGLAILATAALTSPPLRLRLVRAWESGVVVGSRAQLVVFGAEKLMDRPWLGHGPGLFDRLYAKGVASGESWAGAKLSPIGMPWVHCLPLEIGIDLGVTGVAAFGSVAFAATRRLRAADRRADAMARAVAAASGVMLLSIAAIGLVDLTLLKDWFRCILWLALGLAFVTGPMASPRPKDVAETPAKGPEPAFPAEKLVARA